MIVDHYTCFAQAYATTTESAKCVAEKIFDDYALKWGFPKGIHYDMGGECEKPVVGTATEDL